MKEEFVDTDETTKRNLEFVKKALGSGILQNVIAAMALIAAIVFFSAGRERKELQIVVLSNTSLISVEKSIAEDISIFYRGQPVTNLSLLQLKIQVIGNQPIREDDYSSPVELVFPSQSKLIQATVLETEPPNIKMTLQIKNNIVVLSPTLLNAGDRVIVRLLVEELTLNGVEKLPFRADARIAGVRNVSVINAIDQPAVKTTDLLDQIINSIFGFIGIMAMVYFLVGGFSYITAGGDSRKVAAAKDAITFALVGILLALCGTFFVQLLRSLLGH